MNAHDGLLAYSSHVDLTVGNCRSIKELKTRNDAIAKAYRADDKQRLRDEHIVDESDDHSPVLFDGYCTRCWERGYTSAVIEMRKHIEALQTPHIDLASTPVTVENKFFGEANSKDLYFGETNND